MSNIQEIYCQNPVVMDAFLISLIQKDFKLALGVVSILNDISENLRLYLSNFLLDNLSSLEIMNLVQPVLIDKVVEKNNGSINESNNLVICKFLSQIKQWNDVEIPDSEINFINAICNEGKIKDKKLLIKFFLANHKNHLTDYLIINAIIWKILNHKNVLKNISCNIYLFKYMVELIGVNSEDLGFLMKAFLYEFHLYSYSPNNFIVMLLSYNLELMMFENWSIHELELLYKVLMNDYLQKKLSSRDNSKLIKVNTFFFNKFLNNLLYKEDSQALLEKIYYYLESKDLSIWDRERQEARLILRLGLKKNNL